MQFKHPSVRRTAALLAVPALALSALAVSPAPASAAAGALIGAVMKEMRGQADAGRVRELILEKLQ